MDATAWILGSAILALATVDLLVWASINNVPNPISKLIAGEAHAPVRHAGR